MFTQAAKLLSVSRDAKTIKGEKVGILTGVLYMAPHTLAGYQVCPSATEGCMAACLYTAGQGRYSNVQTARLNRTRWFFEGRESFMATLVVDILRLVRKADKEGMKAAVRLNGTSDIAWEKMKVTVSGVEYRSLMEAFPAVQFYDYTKILGRKLALSLPNYHLTFSLAENNDAFAQKALEEGYNVAVVMSAKRAEAKPETWGGWPVVDGDKDDVRFNDPKGGHIIALFAKGAATKDTTGFVRPTNGGFRTASLSRIRQVVETKGVIEYALAA
jgi:hypothetical protein